MQARQQEGEGQGEGEGEGEGEWGLGEGRREKISSATCLDAIYYVHD
jgi:hypothetical protein